MSDLISGSYRLYLVDEAGNLSTSTSTVTLDTVAPTLAALPKLLSASGMVNGVLVAGSVVTASVVFTEQVDIQGVPLLRMDVGGTLVNATFLNSSNSFGKTTAQFFYTVGSGLRDADGISILQNGLTLNGASIKDAAGNSATLTHALVAGNAAYKVDATAPATLALTMASDTGSSTTDNISSSGVMNISTPEAGAATLYPSAITIDATTATVSSIAISGATGIQNGMLNAGDVVTIAATFSEAVNVIDSPFLRLNLGATLVNATYASGGGSSILNFVYTILAAQTDANGISVAADALALNTGRIKDTAGKLAKLTHALVPDNAAYKVDTTAPATLTLTMASDTGSSSGVMNIGALEASATWEYSTNSGTSWKAGTGSTFTLGAGTYAANAVQVRQTDAAGNTGAATLYASAITIDATAATVSSIAISGATGIQNGTLNAGDVVTATVAFNETVHVTGTPQLGLNIGGSTVQANYAAGKGTANLTFTYTILAGQTDANGISVAANALALNAGTIKDTAGNNATLTHALVADNAAYKVDATAPATLTLTMASDTGISATDNISSSGVMNISAPEAGASWEYSTNSGTSWKAGTGSTFTLGAGTYAANAVQVRQTDAAGNTGAATLYAGAITIDATAATVSSIAISGATGIQNGTLNAGDVVTATVAFNETVRVTGTPQLGLNIGGSTVQGNYAAGTGTANLTFIYTILVGQTDANGISFALNSLALNAGTIKDTAGNNATLTHALVADNAAYKVDATAPATLTLTMASDTGISTTDNISSSGVMNIGALEASATWQYSTNSGTSWKAGTGSTFTLGAGTYAANAVQVRQTDAAGNTGTATLYAGAITIDATAATVSSIAISGATGIQNGTLNAGDVVTATVAFNETVHVTGTPQLGLNIGGAAVQANYAAGKGTANLTFTYTILAGQTDANGISVAANALALNAGTIKDTAGNNATLTHALVADNAAYKVDATAPATLTLTMASDTGISATDNISSSGVMNISAPEAGASWEYSTNSGTSWKAGTGSTFTLSAGTYAANAVQVRQTDAAGNTGAATLYAGAITIDATAATVSSIAISGATGIQNGTLNAGDVVTATVAFNETVHVTGTPQLGLNIGGTVVQANYAAGKGTANLTFTYTILAGQTDANGISVAANALALNAGTIKDTAGNNATLTHALVADNAAYKVDATLPVTLTLTMASDTGISTTDNISSSGVMNISAPEAGASWEYSTNSGTSWKAGTGSTFTLSAGTYAANAVQVRQTDAAGNTGAATLYASAITIDATAATVSSIAISGATGIQNGTLNAGDVVTATVAFNETVHVTGTPQLGLNIGGSTVQANYAAGKGTANLTFTYTILAGQTDANGISVAANALALNAGTIKDTAGNNATLTHALVADNAAYKVDATLPVTLTLTMASDTGISATDNISSSGVMNISAPEAGASWEYSTNSGTSWKAGTGSTFTLSAGTYAANAVQVRQTDAAGNTGAATLYAGAITIDATAATVSSIAISGATGIQNGTLNAGDVVTATVVFNETVHVTGTPQLGLNIGGTAVQANYAAGKGTANLTFTYTILAGQTDANGISVAANALALNAGTIKDTAGNNATLTHALVADNAAYKVDTTAPATLTLTMASDTGISTTDNISSSGVMNISAPEAGASWEYSTNSGTSWKAGTGSTFTLGAGTYAANAVQVRQTDAAGNTGAATLYASAITIDATAATVSSIAISGATGIQNGTLNAGDVVTATVAFNETVHVTGTPQLGLTIGATAVNATYASGGGTSTLNFVYTILAAQTDANGISVAANALALNAGTIKDTAGNNATLTHALVADNAAYKVDATAPATLTLTMASDTGISTTDNISSSGVMNISAPEAGASWEYSTNSGTSWKAGTGSTFTLSAGTYAANAVQVRQTDAAGNTGAATLYASAITIDARAATVSSIAISGATGIQNGTLNAGDVVTATVAFNETVHVTGTPQLGLNIGGSTVQANYAAGKGTANLTFTYTILAGQTDANGISVAANALALNAGTIKDTAGNNATLTHALVADNAAYKVDTTAPATLTLTMASDTGISATDNISSSGVMNISAPEAGASWEYSTNSGTSWKAGTGSTFTLGAGTYAANAVQVRQTDAAGNTGAATLYAGAITIDATAATVSSIAISGATGIQNGTLNAGDVVTATVAFNETVHVTGTPQLGLNIGGSTVQANYAAGKGTANLTFTYTILAGQTDANGISFALNSVALNAGSIKDTAGNNATLTHALVADNAAYKVDATLPVTLTLTMASDTGISATDNISSSGVMNISAPEAGASWEYSTNSGTSWKAGTGSTFTLSAGTYAANAVQVRQTDAAGNTGAATLYASAITIDARAATVSSIAISGATGIQNGTLNAGDVVTATVAFNETVHVTGTPQLGLNIGGSTVQANYAAGKGTANLTFTYTILAGQTDANGISVAANALALNAGSIKDTAGNNATLTHALVADNAAYKVDTTAPATLTLTMASDTGISTTDNISSSGVMNISAPEAGASWEYSTNSGTSWKAVTGSTFTLGAGTYAANAVQVRQTDAAGNTGAATLYAGAITIDATAATVSSIAISGATGIQNGTLNAGDVVTATVAFNETVHVTGTPQLGLNIGGSTVQANYAAGKGTANLTFTYTILAGQTDANGISFALNSLALNAGSIKDTAGNNATLTHALVADNAAYKVDTAAPTFTSLATASTPENVLTTSAVYTAQATDATGTVSYSLNGTDASKFSINSGTGEVKFITSPDFEAPTDIGLNNVYDINVVATDLAGNASTTAVAITVTNVSEYGSPAGDSVIDLGSYGKLIHPVQVEGKWYYYWDLSGNGTNEDKGELNGGTDRTNGWFLDHTFKYASDFTTVDPYVDIQHPESTNHTYRYAILNGVKLALPTYGGPVDANDRLTSAGHLVPTAVSSGTVNNSTYNDLAAIWDAFNGSSTTDNTDGLPTGWADNAYYLSATELNGRGTHAAVGLGTGGYVTSFAEYATSLEPNHTGKMWVALQVL